MHFTNGKKKGSLFVRRLSSIVFFFVFISISLAGTAFAEFAWVWDMVPEMPTDDPAWLTLKEKWPLRFQEKNIDGILQLVESIEKKYPDRVEPKLYLGKVLFLKAQYKKRHNEDLYKRV